MQLDQNDHNTNIVALFISWLLNISYIISKGDITWALGCIATILVIANGAVTLYKNIKNKKQ